MSLLLSILYVITIRSHGWDQEEESEVPGNKQKGHSLLSARAGWVAARELLLTLAILHALQLYPGPGSALWDFSKFAQCIGMPEQMQPLDSGTGNSI